MKRFLTGAMALLMAGTATAAMAQPYGGYDRHRGGGYSRDRDRDCRPDRYENDRGRRHDRGGCRQARHRWQRGHRWNQSYGGYYVSDYGRYRLRPPPRGYRWVRTNDGDYLMVAIATGIIASVILNNNGY